MEIGICGNYQNGLRDLSDSVQKIFSRSCMNVQIHCYNSAALLLSRREKLAQLNLLIWNLRVLPGDFSEIIISLRKWHFTGDCIFITDEPDAMQQLSGVRPANVLIRTEKLADMLEARLQDAYARWLERESSQFLLLPGQGHLRPVPLRDIYCARTDGAMVLIYYGKSLLGLEDASWKTVASQLLSCGFLSCSDTCMINSRMITAVLPGKKEHRVILSNGKFFSVQPDTASALEAQYSFTAKRIAQ